MRPYSSQHKNRKLSEIENHIYQVPNIQRKVFPFSYEILLFFTKITSNHTPLERNICTDMFPIMLKHTLIASLK
jgi:hypothetical protein